MSLSRPSRRCYVDWLAALLPRVIMPGVVRPDEANRTAASPYAGRCNPLPMPFLLTFTLDVTRRPYAGRSVGLPQAHDRAKASARGHQQPKALSLIFQEGGCIATAQSSFLIIIHILRDIHQNVFRDGRRDSHNDRTLTPS